MNSGTIAAIFAGLTFVLTLFGIVFVGGKLVRTVEDHGLSINKHDDILADHDRRLGANELDIHGFKMWHKGYEARAGEIAGDAVGPKR